jgi:preprotein translocase subunit YajC
MTKPRRDCIGCVGDDDGGGIVVTLIRSRRITTQMVLVLFIMVLVLYTLYGTQQQQQQQQQQWSRLTTGTSPIITTSTVINVQVETILVLCIDDQEYGQTFNQILTITAARTMAYELTRTLNNNNNNNKNNPIHTTVKVGLGPTFSAMYDAVLLPQDDIRLYYYVDSTSMDQLCDYIYTAMDLFNLFFEYNWYPHRVSMIQSLLPNPYIQEQAVRYLEPYRDPLISTNNNNNENYIITNTSTSTGSGVPSSSNQQQKRHRRIITVHRRYFEGTCPTLIEDRNNVACLHGTNANKKDSSLFLTDADLIHICNVNYNDTVHDDLSHPQVQDTDSTVVLLCTDRQVPEHDNTFPNIVTIPPLDESHQHPAILVMIEAWIMTLSDVHYGVPMSTIDVVIHFWRRNKKYTTTTTTTTSSSSSSTTASTSTSTYHREMRPLVCYGDDS